MAQDTEEGGITMQNIVIAGKIGGDAVTRSTQSGDKVTSFNVAVDVRDGREKSTNWWRVSMWGKRGESLAQYLLKGASVTVSGDFSLGEYEGKPQLNIRANDVALQGGRSGEQRETTGNGGSGNASRGRRAFDDNLDDDEIPFIRGDGVF
jgi:single-strand DNA-binding protein